MIVVFAPIHVASLLVRLRLVGKTRLPCRRAQAASASEQEHNLNFVTRKGNIVVVFRLKEENVFKKRALIEVRNFFGHLDKSTMEAESFAHWFSKYGFDGGA